MAYFTIDSQNLQLVYFMIYSLKMLIKLTPSTEIKIVNVNNKINILAKSIYS